MDHDIYRPAWGDTSIDSMFTRLCSDMLLAPVVDTGHWQAKKNVPQVITRELLNVRMDVPIPASSGSWAAWMKPNLPWAEDHFQERVSGKPLNPPPSHVYWPYNQRGNEDHLPDGKVFSHSYPERLWPKYLYNYPRDDVREGIRYPYGDLGDAVRLLVREPFTRQCYAPLWFPEDLYAASVEGQRVPCTLGYHFVLRDGKLHCFYPMRSLDILRYLRDDAYMAGRLCQWMIEQCRNGSGENSVWQDVVPGVLTLHAVCMHIFQGDEQIIRLQQSSAKKEAVG